MRGVVGGVSLSTCRIIDAFQDQEICSLRYLRKGLEGSVGRQIFASPPRVTPWFNGRRRLFNLGHEDVRERESISIVRAQAGPWALA